MPLKRESRKRRRRHRAGREEESESSGAESGSRPAYMDEDAGGPAAEALATDVSALKVQLQEAQAMLNVLLKREKEITQPLIFPGGSPQPADKAKPWWGCDPKSASNVYP